MFCVRCSDQVSQFKATVECNSCGAVYCEECVKTETDIPKKCDNCGDDRFSSSFSTIWDEPEVSEPELKASEPEPEEAVQETVEHTELDRVLEERGNEYGPFINNALISQMLKHVVASSRSKDRLFQADEAEALEMICHKMARIINGKEKADNWWDIAGYASLVAERIKSQQEVGK